MPTIDTVVSYGKQCGYKVKVLKSQTGIYIEGQKQINGGIETVNLGMVYMLRRCRVV